MLTIYINGIRYMNHDEKKQDFYLKKEHFIFLDIKKLIFKINIVY